MEWSAKTEQAYKINDRKVARISAISTFALLAIVLSFVGYQISRPQLPSTSAQEETEYIPLDAQFLEQLGSGGGAGSPADVSHAKTTPPQMQEILHASESAVHSQSGNSAITNSPTPTDQASVAKYTADNPFGTGGIDGKNSRGTVGKDWTDDEPAHLKGGEKINRFLVEKPNTNSIQSDENCTIVLSVLVNPNGTIIGNPTFVKSHSTTNDLILINQVISVVKNQAQFNKVNTAKNTKESISIRITAN